MYFMGIDVGTSSTKSAIFDEKGSVLGLAAVNHDFDADKPGYAEQNPDVWWNAAVRSIGEAIARAKIHGKEIKSIGLSGQMHGLIPLDRDGRVIRNAILHCDVRAKDEAEQIKDLFPGGEFSTITYNPVFPGFQAVSLLWLRNHEPENFEKIQTILCPKDYVRYRLTGNLGTESTDASGTLLYDMRGETWSREVFRRLQLSEEIVPRPICGSCDVAGHVSPAAAAATGLSTDTLVVYGGADQAMHSIGNGVYCEGAMMATIGTSGQILMITRSPVLNGRMNTHTFRHVRRHTWYALAAVLHAGSTLNWFRRTFTPGLSYDDLSVLAEQVAPCCDGLVFFPCMGGERTPYVDSQTRGLYEGISMNHTLGHFARATMEGVTFAMRAGIEIMNQLYGTEKKLICAGGGVKGDTWAQIQADIYGRPIYASHLSEQACLGAAVVAGIGAGCFADLPQGCSAMVAKSERVFEPDTQRAALYDAFYHSAYEKIYPQNSSIFNALNGD